MKKTFGLLFLLFGVFLITNSPSITGGVIGAELSATINPFLGFFMIFISVILFLSKKHI